MAVVIIQEPDTISLSENPIIFEISHSANLTILIKNADDLLIGSEIINTTTAVLSTIDIHEYIAPVMNQTNTYTDSDNLVNVYEDKVISFKIYIYEYIENQTNINITVIKGKLPEEVLFQFTKNNLTFWQNMDQKKHFLTISSKTKKVFPSQKHFIFFKDVDFFSSYPINLNVLFYETEISFETKKILASNSNEFVYQLNCSYSKLLTYFDTSKKYIKYQVFLTNDNDEPISEILTFEVDHKYYREKKDFRFRNSLGTFDYVRCTGENNMEVDFTRTTIQKIDYSKAQLFCDEDVIYKANTGHVSKDFTTYFREFLRSEEIYEVLEDGTQVPVRLTSASVQLQNSNLLLYSVSFEYTRLELSQWVLTNNIPTEEDMYLLLGILQDKNGFFMYDKNNYYLTT